MVWPTNNSNTLWGKEKKETERERKMLKGKIIHEEKSRPQKEIAQCVQGTTRRPVLWRVQYRT